MHPLVKRYINVAVDGLVQAAVVAIVGAAMVAALITFGRLRGPWMDRALGAAVGIVFVPLAVLALKVLGLRRSRTAKLLEIPKGFLDYKWDIENAMQALTVIVIKLGAIMREVGPAFEKHTKSMQRATSGTAFQQLAVSKAAASSLDGYSARMERLRARYVKTGKLLADGLRGWSNWIERTHPAKSGLAGFPEAMEEFKNGLNSSNDQLRTYIATLEGGKGASQYWMLPLSLTLAHYASFWKRT